MGALTAFDLADNGFGLSLEQQIRFHLVGNHYPPLPEFMVSVCLQAIDSINAGDEDAMVDLPAGVSYKGNAQAPAWAIAEQHHLDAWLS